MPAEPIPAVATWSARLPKLLAGGCTIIYSQDLSWHPKRSVIPHQHSFHQLDYFYGGAGTVTIAGGDYAAAAGDLFIANPGDRHAFVAAGSHPLQGVTFKIRFHSGGRARLPNHLANLDVLPPRERRELDAMLRRACIEANSRDFGGPLAAAGQITSFFALLWRYLNQAEQRRETTLDLDQPRTVLRYLDAHCDQPLTLADLGKLVGLHPRYFCAKFSKLTGISPLAALNRARIARSRALLAKTRLSIADIGARCGFADVYHFSRRFKQLTGSSPLEYRREATL